MLAQRRLFGAAYAVDLNSNGSSKGFFPTEKMKWSVYQMLGSLVFLWEMILGNLIDTTLCLPSDPIDFLILLEQKSSHNLELSSCQSALSLISYTSSLYDERLADDKLVLASLEKYILWLFQQEKLSTPLSYQLLKFSGKNIANGIIVHGKNSHMVNVNLIAELIAGGDNHGSTLLVSLLTQLLEKGHENDIISVVNLVATIINIFPIASDQLCLHVLIGPSKAIIFSTSLVSTINSAIHEACLKGPALVDHDEETSSGEKVSSSYFFSLRSLHTVLPGIVDWKNFFDPADRVQPISFFGIFCHDLCTLYCLLALFTRISDQRNRTGEELVCTMDYLRFVMAVLEGLIFSSDLSGYELWLLPINDGTSVTTKNNWSRMIVEELVMSLAVPCLASKSFINLHKPAIHVAVTLLKRPKVPEWMRSMFDDSCISGIIQYLAANNLST
ncbi:LOW QUALITY PROTEIN: hypothetical protein PRUPE_1G176200 [Prunus persica]|uniref:Uncharacterized protein n=1 Tax=Prunus persica TaxID=3760 RepID=A0A251R1W5_PRUPE|nr:LOW QUALITY PROTEIN: hypothetical protein PRUPE_1G176200 [Prunus persica]